MSLTRRAVSTVRVRVSLLKRELTLQWCAPAADVIAAMDLACCALYVAWTFESDARLGDLVIDNLLYQVAKKYSEVQQVRAGSY